MLSYRQPVIGLSFFIIHPKTKVKNKDFAMGAHPNLLGSVWVPGYPLRVRTKGKYNLTTLLRALHYYPSRWVSIENFSY